MDTIYKKVADLMVDLKPIVALTGAGISAESGIPTFDAPVRIKCVNV